MAQTIASYVLFPPVYVLLWIVFLSCAVQSFAEWLSRFFTKKG